MLRWNQRGNYRFVEASGPFSAGAVADTGFEIVHAEFHDLPPLAEGYEWIERHLEREARPMQALCGIEMRIPRPLSAEEFRAFNAEYVDRLAAWELPLEGKVPVARSNLAPVVDPVTEPSLFGFSYTVASDYAGATFVVSGIPELRVVDGSAEVIRKGEATIDAMREKIEHVLMMLSSRLGEMSVRWDDVTGVELYAVDDLDPLLVSTVLPALGPAGRHGIRRHVAYPPIVDLALEMDVRAVRRELRLGGGR